MSRFAVAITIALLLPIPLQASFRIVHGNPVSGAEFPWMVSIRANLSSTSLGILRELSTCGASLIANDPVIILTAAHCVENYQQNVDGVVNYVYVDEYGTTQYVKADVNFDFGRTYPNKYNSSDIYYTLPLTNVSTQIYIHPQWNIEYLTAGFDIALVILKNDSLTQILNIPNVIDQLVDDNVCCLNNEKLDLIGYGRNETDGVAAEQLEETYVKYVNVSTCVKMWVDYAHSTLNDTYGIYTEDQLYDAWTLETNIICILGNDTDICQGDSGGPLFRLVDNEIQIVGVTSFTRFGCNDEGVPSGYTSVGHYKDWIDKVINAVVYGITVEPTRSPTIEPTHVEPGNKANHLCIIKAILSTLLIVMWT